MSTTHLTAEEMGMAGMNHLLAAAAAGLLTMVLAGSAVAAMDGNIGLDTDPVPHHIGIHGLLVWCINSLVKTVTEALLKALLAEAPSDLTFLAACPQKELEAKAPQQ